MTSIYCFFELRRFRLTPKGIYSVRSSIPYKPAVKSGQLTKHIASTRAEFSKRSKITPTSITLKAPEPSSFPHFPTGAKGLRHISLQIQHTHKHDNNSTQQPFPPSSTKTLTQTTRLQAPTPTTPTTPRQTALYMHTRTLAQVHKYRAASAPHQRHRSHHHMLKTLESRSATPQ